MSANAHHDALNLKWAIARMKKPADYTPLDGALVEILAVIQSTEEGPNPSQQTLSSWLGVSRKTIVESTRRVERWGWITRNKRGSKGRALHVLVNTSLLLQLGKNKVTRQDRQKVAAESARLGKIYQSTILNHHQDSGLAVLRRYRHPRWLRSATHHLSQLVLRSEGLNTEHVIGFASNDQRYSRRFWLGPYHLLGCWDSVIEDFKTECQKG